MQAQPYGIGNAAPPAYYPPPGTSVPMQTSPVMMQGMAPPSPVTMDRLLQSEGIMMKQLTNECCRCFFCQPNIHWTLHPYAKDGGDMANQDAGVWVQEDASYCGRCWSCCAPGARATTYRTIDGAPDKNAPTSMKSVMTHEKGSTCGQNVIVMITDNGPLRCPCCCYLPYLRTKDGSGNLLGTTKYLCDMCPFVPKFKVEDTNGQDVYYIRPDVCCLGACMKCKCGGPKGKCCTVPFLIRDPRTLSQIEEAEITDLWAGFKNECCTKRNLYGIKFPSAASAEQRATLVGAALLIDVAIFEQQS